MTTQNHKQFLDHKTALDILPRIPHPDRTTEKYLFLDSRKVAENMFDLGFHLADFRRPKARTDRGGFGLHELDFRRAEDMDINGKEAPRILFFNSYDGSRKAQFIGGLIRFACSNGLVLGDFLQNEKFLHMGDEAAADELLNQVVALAEQTQQTFKKLDHFREVELEPGVYLQMAEEALALRYPDEEHRLDINPQVLLMPRRIEDNRNDLFTRWNVLQENLVKGGVPGVNPNGDVRVSSPVSNIDRSTTLNARLWELLESYSGIDLEGTKTEEPTRSQVEVA